MAGDTVPKMYKGKKTMEMTGPEYTKMLKELGMDKPSKTAPKGDFNEEPDMGSAKKKAYAKGGAVKAKFKPCASCPSPAKCKAAGKCMASSGTKKAATGAKAMSKGAAGMLVIPVKVSTKKMPAKAKAKK